MKAAREIARRLAGLGDSPARTGAAAGLGVFIGLLPVAPFQTLLAIAMAFALRLNRVAVFSGTMVWQPFTAPFIVGAELAAGKLLLPASQAGQGWGGRLVAPLALGAVLIGICGGVASGLAVFWAKLLLNRRKSPSRVSSEEGAV